MAAGGRISLQPRLPLRPKRAAKTRRRAPFQPGL